MPTAADVAATIATTAADGVQKATVGDRTAEAVPIPDLIAAEKHLAARSSVSGTAATGGPVSAWNRTRVARSVPPGAV